MLATLAFAAFLVSPGQAEAIKLRDANGAESGMVVLSQPILDIPKTAPKNRSWSFEYLTAGYVPSSTDKSKSELRFMCYSQKRPANDPALGVVQMLLRLWSYNRHRLKIDHSPGYSERQIHLYLCEEGKAGGEQRFGEDRYVDPATGKAVSTKVNTIYIYEMATFTKDRSEMVREIAHEYGHATLPPVGPFSKPEDWANGHLGEGLYVRWLFEDLVNRRIQRGDVLGATAEGLERYLKRFADPLIRKVALQGPDLVAMGKKGSAAMDAYLGLAFYAERILPPVAFSRSLMLAGSMKPLDYAEAAVRAATEDRWTVRVPYGYEGQKIWLPVGKQRISGAPVLARRGDWVQVLVASKPIVVGG
ncbi:MAG: hypothetical protein K1X67_26260 [Fimbriimonadaceae bacterium]|nr:hypothetical protein [Fimbriimonadaceae bacterium]